MLSKPTAICATTLSEPFPASKTSASIESRSVVIKPSIPLFTFSMINFFRGRLRPLEKPRARNHARANDSRPDHRCARWQKTRKRLLSLGVIWNVIEQFVQAAEVRPAALFPKGIFETLANTRADELATIHDALHCYGSIFEAISPIQPTVPDQGTPVSLLVPGILQ